MKPKYWKKACLELSKVDPALGSIIKNYRGEFLKSRGQSFETLMRSIVGQQISVKAAQSVWDRVICAFEITPKVILGCDPNSLRSCGLSNKKVEYCKDLAQKFMDKTITPEEWFHLDDETIIKQLVAVKGIGRWTAEMFLIFFLLRPNVFPKADLGLQKAISIAYKKKYPMSERQLEIFRKKYSPWGTVATWYLWRSLDPIPVEY